MPLSELYCMAKGKLGSNQQKTTNYSTDLSFIPDNDIVELVWENGQILTHGQSSRERKTSTSNSLPSYDLPSYTSKYREKDKGNGSNPKGEKFGSMDAILNDFSASVPSGEMGLSPNDDMVPWYNYSIDDSSLQQDYCSDFLTELSGVTVNELSNTQNDFATMEKKSYFTQTLRDSNSFSVSNGTSVEQGNASKVASELTRRSQFNPFSSQQCPTPFPSYRSRIADISSDNTIKAPLNAVSGDSALIQAPSSGSHSSKTQKQNSGPPNSGTGFINFSHFSRPAAMVAANNFGAVAGSSLSNIERRTCKEKGSAASSANPLESTFIDSNNSLQKETGSNSQPVLAPTNIDLKSGIATPLEEPRPAEQSGAVSHGDTSKNDKSPNQIGGSNASRGIPDGGKIIEPVVASSSVCSVNSVDRASNDPTHHLKRKCRDTEESDDPSEDVEEESVGAKKAAPARGGTGSKRSRAAEVHNLSERRRRDRINEKMRALQELIPNCNKVDKASMLDEAIEYLKTLQLQVQIMSMGTGLCMPPMMMPAGMQHMHAAHMAHLSAMGMGMGMGMGFGMSMVDVNGASPRCPIMQVPPMQAAHFPGPPIPGAPSLHGMAGSNLPMFGHHPGQGNPMSMPHSPLIPFSAGPPMKLAIGLNPAGPGGPMGNFNSAQASTLKDPVQQTNAKVMQNTDTNSLMKTTSSQATKEG